MCGVLLPRVVMSSAAAASSSSSSSSPSSCASIDDSLYVARQLKNDRKAAWDRLRAAYQDLPPERWKQLRRRLRWIPLMFQRAVYRRMRKRGVSETTHQHIDIRTHAARAHTHSR